jgi:hypothetical protein
MGFFWQIPQANQPRLLRMATKFFADIYILLGLTGLSIEFQGQSLTDIPIPHFVPIKVLVIFFFFCMYLFFLVFLYMHPKMSICMNGLTAYCIVI